MLDILDRLLSAKDDDGFPYDNRLSPMGDRGWSDNIGAVALPTAAGPTVTESNALEFSAAWCAVTTLAELVGSLPFFVYKRLEDREREQDPTHELYDMIHLQPNPLMSSQIFWESMQGVLALYGNAYAEIEYDVRGNILALWPIHPSRVQVRRRGGSVIYRVEIGPGADPVWLLPREIVHVRGFSESGLFGISPVRKNKESIGGAIAGEQFANVYFAEATVPSGVMSVKGIRGDERKKNLIQQVKDMHGGSGRAHRVLLTNELIEWKQIASDPEKSQLHQTRGFSVQTMSRVFRIPLPFLGDPASLTWRNVEQLGAVLERFTLRGAVKRIEDEVNTKCFVDRTHFAEMEVGGILRADSKTRHTSYRQGIEFGGYTVNEIRRLENRPGVGPNGDVPFVPKALQTLDAAIAETGDSKKDREQQAARTLEALRETAVTFVARVIEKERHELSAAQSWRSKESAAKYKRRVDKLYGSELSVKLVDALTPTLAPILVSQRLPTGPLSAWARWRVGEWVAQRKALALDESFDATSIVPIDAATTLVTDFEQTFLNNGG